MSSTSFAQTSISSHNNVELKNNKKIKREICSYLSDNESYETDETKCDTPSFSSTNSKCSSIQSEKCSKPNFKNELSVNKFHCNEEANFNGETYIKNLTVEKFSNMQEQDEVFTFIPKADSPLKVMFNKSMKKIFCDTTQNSLKIVIDNVDHLFSGFTFTIKDISFLRDIGSSFTVVIEGNEDILFENTMNEYQDNFVLNSIGESVTFVLFKTEDKNYFLIQDYFPGKVRINQYVGLNFKKINNEQLIKKFIKI